MRQRSAPVQVGQGFIARTHRSNPQARIRNQRPLKISEGLLFGLWPHEPPTRERSNGTQCLLDLLPFKTSRGSAQLRCGPLVAGPDEHRVDLDVGQRMLRQAHVFNARFPPRPTLPPVKSDAAGTLAVIGRTYLGRGAAGYGCAMSFRPLMVMTCPQMRRSSRSKAFSTSPTQLSQLGTLGAWGRPLHSNVLSSARSGLPRRGPSMAMVCQRSMRPSIDRSRNRFAAIFDNNSRCHPPCRFHDHGHGDVLGRPHRWQSLPGESRPSCSGLFLDQRLRRQHVFDL